MKECLVLYSHRKNEPFVLMLHEVWLSKWWNCVEWL